MPSSTTTAVAAKTEPKEDKNDFFWTYTEEPHRTRRMAIIKAHPEVNALPFPAHLRSFAFESRQRSS
jgi:sphingolipid delta-4 desaturase